MPSPFHQKNLLGVVYFRQLEYDEFVHRNLNMASDESGFNRNFAMAAVDQHAELDLTRSTVREQSVERCASGSAGKQHIIHQNNVLVLNGETNLFFLHDRLGPEGREIVTIESDIQGTDRDFRTFDAGNNFADPFSKRNATPANAHQSQP